MNIYVKNLSCTLHLLVVYHRNLIWLFKHSHKGMIIGRWYASLTAFDLDITYVSGKSQLVADPLSRLFKQVQEGSYSENSNPFLTQEDQTGAAALLSAMAFVQANRLWVQPVTGRRGSLYSIPAALATHLPKPVEAAPTIESIGGADNLVSESEEYP